MNKISKQLIKIARDLMVNNEINNTYYFKEVDGGYIIFENKNGQEESIDGNKYLQYDCNLSVLKKYNCNYLVDKQGEDPIMQQLSELSNVGKLYWGFLNNQSAWIDSSFKNKIINNIIECTDIDDQLANDWDYVEVLRFILQNFDVLSQKNKKYAAQLFILQVDASISNGDYYGKDPMIIKFIKKYKSNAIKYLLQNRQQLTRIFKYANDEELEDHLAIDSDTIKEIQYMIFDMANNSIKQ